MKQETIVCLFCDKEVPYPQDPETGYGRHFTCQFCGAIYFAEIGEDAGYDFDDLDPTRFYIEGKSKLEIRALENFDRLSDPDLGKEDMFPAIYNLYFVKVP